LELRAENEAIPEMLATGPEDQLRAIPGVKHVSVGLKDTGGKVTDQLCIRVYVKEKKDQQELTPAELIPSDINGVPTDVNVLPEIEFQDDNRKYRPIQLREISEASAEAIDEVKEIIYDLRPIQLDRLGLTRSYRRHR
jgi:hypothetical protein